MPKTITLQGTELGTDITEMNIYHTEITGGNLLKSAVRRSDLLAGVTLYNVPDSATEFLIDCTSGKCTATSGSISIDTYSQNTTYATIGIVNAGSGYYGQVNTVSITSPSSLVTSFTTGTISSRFQWSDYGLVQLVATPAYPNTFQEWNTKANGSGTTLSSTTSLTVTSISAYDGKYYAIFNT